MIRVDNVVGRAWLRYWPFDVFGPVGGTGGQEGGGSAAT